MGASLLALAKSIYYDILMYMCKFHHRCLMRVSMGWWLLRLSANILALLRLSINLFQLRLTKMLKINFFCFKELNINEPVFFVS